MEKQEHVLVVGGFGMLKGVVEFFIVQGMAVSVVGRTLSKMQNLAQEFKNLPGTMNPIAIDYTNTDDFIRAISHAITQYGPITTSVNWIHSTAPHAPQALLELQNTSSPDSTFLRLLGSAYGNPEKKSNDQDFMKKAYPNIHYREVILGFVLEVASSRWLTHQEICQGVIETIEDPVAQKIIGTVSPWSKRP
ncbi:SDR family NAD(P)-dependent oxidoreductase [Robertmurraya yapensis]|uniref:SDR family NAD(P)-dependent oxidoreductase n=1 Tax=Bacillus yapensis TaxID=2492960 RepID=A0A3S0KR09_9BACI|nr:SDR family NAD(P)-dependent oxidoreductase [Bacillus yapensis]RTR36307.1 SDR family NAD(P)-dependent oxidoreductase [Bacillus yapensis]TKT05810.1 SDR family NAD(P)-dependent oxidoreductase [Bacillus yapensis]